jgi:hypothetical protein
MGVKTWMLVYADSNPREALSNRPKLDSEATHRLARALFPGEKLELLGDGDLSCTCPPDDELDIGCFAGVTVVAAKEFGIDHPSELTKSFVTAGGNGKIYLHAMHSVVEWFAFGHWSGGKLLRSLSLTRDYGILEDIGQRLPFEEQYWSRPHAEVDGEDEEGYYPLSIGPLDLGEVALCELFGYELGDFLCSTLFEPESIPLVRYKRSKRGWRFWH